MKCPACSIEIPGAAKFCPECGSSLSPTTPASPTEADRSTLLQKYIPPELAKRILSAGKQIESERRLVTVLFVDVSGFTSMSEKLDAEEVSAVLNDCFKGLISIVYKYEGVIDKFIGDEIMAIFGAPLTHENDPERAVRCSMEMMDYMGRFNQLSPVALPEPLGLHISMNTGMVVAGNVGSDLRMNYSVIGDTVNLASRLKHVAERGEIVVTENTYRIVSSLVNADESRLVEIKGKSEPAKIYRIVSLKGGIEPGTRITQKSPIIGREQEIDQLKTAVGQVLQKKEQRFFIRGEAGVGKTRLKLELIQHAKSSGITAYEGKCSSFEINTPYYLWTTLLKDILQLKPDTGESETRKRLHDMLQILSMEKLEPYLATLLSLRYEEILLEEDKERKNRIFESLKEFIRALSKRKPSLFLPEDIHWIDRFSQDMLIYLFSEKELAPAMFVPLFRDEYVHSKELIEKGGTLIDLNRLSKPDAQKLICARLQAEDIPDNLVDVIYKRSEGNPFFIEELVKTLLDKNVVAVRKQKLEILKPDFENILPETVQGVIMARIDRLEEKLKDVLYGASVIGREFDKSLLKEILKKKETVDLSLHELLSLELILEKEEAHELAYLFKHYLIQEVAYNTILQKKRRELHKLIAQAIEKVYAEKLKDFYELLSFHYEKAEEWEKAAEYLSRSGNKVREIFAKEESKEFSMRKDKAIEQLYASGKARRGFKGILSNLFGVLLILFTLFFMVLIAGDTVYQVTGYHILPFGSYHRKAMSPGNAFGAFIWIAMILYFCIRVSKLFLRKVPRLYEILDDSVKIHFTKTKIFSIPFEDIEFIAFFENLNPKGDKFRERRQTLRKSYGKLLYESLIYSSFIPVILQKRIDLNTEIIEPERLLATPAEGEIHVRRKSGSQNIFFKSSIIDKRDIALSPSNPREFHEQLKIAIEKWNKQYGIPTQGMQPAMQTGTAPLMSVRSTLRPALNILSSPRFVIVSIWAVSVCIFNSTLGYAAWKSSAIIPLLFSLFLSIVFLAIPMYLMFPLRRRVAYFFSRVEYHLFPDCIKYGFPGEDWRSIPFYNILGCDLIQSWLQKRAGTGTIRIRATRPIVQMGHNLRTCEYMVDIKNPQEVYDKFNTALMEYRSGVRQQNCAQIAMP
ncbi:MAG: AAA family ATPase [Ignavibacteriales bacterium]|nr:AAA family ATPase [Ignavibacteriales bacterium]